MKARHNRHFIKRRSVALISAAIFCASAAHAELEVGRLPSTSVTGGQVIGVKPNVFLVIDNGKGMSTSPYDTKTHSPDGNLLQQTAGALIAALPQLEGKIRLGYSTSLPGRVGIANYSSGGKAYHCRDFKFNGNVERLAKLEVNDPNSPGGKRKLFPNLKEDIANNHNYLLADEDYVFSQGSGYGELTPRDFSGNYARYIYAWLGAMCPGATSEVGKVTPVSPPSGGHPPYADLRDKANYRAKASAAGNPESYPLRNMINNFASANSRPIIDIHANVLAEISDANFIFKVGLCKSQNHCAPLLSTANVQRDPKRQHLGSYITYDAYSNADPKHGFPGKDNPQSCRKNYEIIISQGPYSVSDRLQSNTRVGNWGLYSTNSWHWTLPTPLASLDNKGITVKQFPLTDMTRHYRHVLPPFGSYGSYKLQDLPTNTAAPGRHYLFSRSVLQSYYMDLRKDLANDVPLYYAPGTPRAHGPNGTTLHKNWDRKNDTVNWQHLTVFNLGFLDHFKSWQAATVYQKDYPDLDPIDGALEGYFRAIEDGTIFKDNFPFYDWSRGNYGPKNGYLYKNKNGTLTPMRLHYTPGLDDPLAEMDFAKAGIVGRGGTYTITDYDSIKKIIGSIADRIEKAMAQEVSGAGAISGGGRVTAVQQMGGNSSALFTSYIDEETVSGNLFAYRNCPLIKEKIKNEAGNWVTNPEWIKGQCGQRLWNAATVLENGKNKIEDKTIFPKKKDGKLVGEKFSWSNIKEDSEAKNALQGGKSEELAKARVDWINGKEDFSDANIAKELRKRPNILIPKEGQRYKIGSDGKPVQDNDGNYVLMDEPGTKIPNRVGEIVYATAQAVDPVGTLGAAHKLNKGDYDTFKNKIKNRPPLVLVGANDGRLYGFTSPKDHYAKLAFSYIPRKVIVDGRLTATTKTSYSTVTAKSLVNGPFRVSDAQVDGKWGTYVVGTLGAGGSTAYALEITSKGEAEFKWEIDIDKGRAKIMAPPRIVWLKEDKSDKKGQWVVLLPSGYNADDVSLIVLDLKDGKEIARIDTGAKYNANCKLQNSASNPYMLEETIKLPEGGTALCVDNGLGDLTVTDGDGDDAADYVYAGDLLGHVWKFDLTNLNLKGKNDKLKVAYERPLFIAKDKQGVRQSITTMIEIDDGAYGEGSMLYFGTGRLFNQQERNMDQRQSFYAVWENPRYFENLYVQLPLKRDESSPYAFMQYEPVTITDIASKLSDPESSLKEYKEIRVIKRVDSLQSDKYLSYDRNGSNINSAAKAMGWVMDFPQESTRERVIDRARTFEEAIFFSSFEPKESDTQESCTPPKGSVGGDGRFYMLDRLTGNTLETSAFDYNHDNKRDDQDKIKVDSSLLGGTLTGTGGAESTKLVSPASLMTPGSANFVQLEGVQERGAECDYTRQVIFPGTVDPETGNPMTLLGCYQNRYRVWKQPVSGN